LTPHVPNPGKYPGLPITECFINYDFVTIADELPEKNIATTGFSERFGSLLQISKELTTKDT